MKKEDLEINKRFSMRSIKEHDLVLMTAERVNLPGDNDDIKKITSAGFLRNYLVKQCAMFGFVSGKNLS